MIYRGSHDLITLYHEDIKQNIKTILCDDSENQYYLKIISSASYEPESFTISDRANEAIFLNQSERDFDEWCNKLIKDQLLRISESMDIAYIDLFNIINKIKKNLKNLLNYQYNGHQIIDCIWNQEFVDILNKIVIYSLFGDFDIECETHREFKRISRMIIPNIIKRISDNDDLKLKDYLKLSIISGISGLDLKGSSAASSEFSQQGIPMLHYNDLPLNESINLYYDNIISLLNHPTHIFEWDYFIKSLNDDIKIVWFTDDYIETFFDLLFLNKLLEMYKDVYVTIVPKRRSFGNDASYSDVLDILKLCKINFNKLNELTKDEMRFKVNKFGPSMGSMNIKKLSNEVIDLIHNSTFVVIKGCRAHEMVQGGLNKTTFNMYVVSREFSESVTGLDARQMPILFFHLPPGGYAFRDFRYRYMREAHINGKKVLLSKKTLSDSYKF